jgi:tetratricopeptide (TPR) repeat protein
VAEPLPAKDSTWEKIALKRTHKDLAKFDSDQDPGFLEVNSRINQCLEDKNYDSALDRCSSFFKYRGNCFLVGIAGTRSLTGADSPAESPVSSIADLLEAQQDAKDESAKAKQNLARKEPSNSKKAIETKQKALKDSLNKSEQYNGLSDSATLAVVQKIAGYAFEVREYEKAEALYKRLFVSTQTEAPCSEKAATVLKDMAAVAVHQGRLVEATKNLRRVRDIQRILGLQEDDLEVLKVTRQIASLYESRDLYGDALQEYNEIINNFPGTVSDKTQGGGDTNAGLLLQRVKRGKHALVMARSKTVDELFSKLAETE